MPSSHHTTHQHSTLLITTDICMELSERQTGSACDEVAWETVRYAIGLIFVGNCDGHVLESYCTGILNLFGGPAGPHACVGTKLF
jgi:hypothetical protein